MPDDLRERIADLRRLLDACDAEPGPPLYAVSAPSSASRCFVHAAVYLAPALADEVDRLRVENARLRAALEPFAGQDHDGWTDDDLQKTLYLQAHHPYGGMGLDKPDLTLGHLRRAADAMKGANRDE